MTSRWVVRLSVAALVGILVLIPVTGSAQQASGIAGLVRDSSGGVLPGVTVEAASPALIEKVRVVATDGEGRYNLVDLRPGAYVVTFTLTGFNTFKREGIALTAGFTATVNADMQVGALEETITVTGAAPLVDTQNVRQQRVVSSELLATLPSSSKSLNALITLTPGLTGTTDVGGSSGLYRSNLVSQNLFRGKGGVRVTFDGMSTTTAVSFHNNYVLNPATAQETTVETGGVSAQSNAIISMNMIPKEGGNAFAFDASGTYTTERLQSDNLTDALRARGVTHTNKVLRFYETTVSVGGPIRRDRLWFFTSGRMAGSRNTVAGVFFNKTQGTPLYTPDLDRPAYRKEWLKTLGTRLTWQVSQKNKVSGFADIQRFFNRGREGFNSPEAGTAFNLWPEGLYQVTWNSPMTNKLLLEAGASYTMNRWPYPSPGDGFMLVKPEDISTLELSTNFRYNAKASYSDTVIEDKYAQRFSASYVTGSHVFKGGVQLEEGVENTHRFVQQDVTYSFLRSVPNLLTQFATPYLLKNRMRDLGLFVQDQWTHRRLTLNYGLRFDYLNGWVPAQHAPAVRFVPFARDFAAMRDIPNWKDLNPRLGASYDLFGNGRTAVKVSFGRFVEASGVSLTNAINPITTSVTQVNRTWNDINRNYEPNCDLLNFGANGECGPIDNVNFGQNNPLATRYADDVLRGFNVRNVTWDVSTEVQHELRPGVSVTGGYYHNWADHFRVTDNLAVTPEDFSPYCITAPVDARLPGGGGYQVCGLYDIAPAKFGKFDNRVTRASEYYGKEAPVTCDASAAIGEYPRFGGASGNYCGTSDFFGASVNTRFGSGIQLGGGVDTGRTVIDNCFVVDSPQQRLNCRGVVPFKAQTQIKVFGSYPLPAGFVVSGTMQNVSGKPVEANYQVSNAAIAPSLGRNLAACGTRAVCAATVRVPLVAPQTLFLDRRTQLDLRLTKAFTLGARTRLRANVDLYNALNASSILGANSNYGSSWLQPTSEQGGVDAILSGRLIHLGGQLTF